MTQEKSLLQKVKEAGSHTLIYGMGAALQSALGFILIPLYTHYYTTDMYGALSLINLCGALAGNFFYFGASSALARSYYDYTDLFERKKVVSTSIYISLFGACLQILVGVLLSNTISQWLFHDKRYTVHIILILVSTAVLFINNLFYMLLRFLRKSKHVVFINILSLVFTSFFIVFLLVRLQIGVMAPILGGLIGQAVTCIVLVYFIRDFVVLDYSKRELKIQLLFGLQAVISGMAYYALDWLNRFFINKYASLSDVGIYTLGYQIGLIINIIFIMPFGQIWAPMRMEYRNDKNANEFYGKMLTYYCVLGLVMTVTVSLFSKELIKVLAGHKEYIHAYKVIPFIMVGLLVYGMVNLIDHGIYFSRKVIYYVYIFMFSLIISAVLNILFLRKHGYIAAAGIIMICYTIITLLVFYLSNKLYKVPYEGRRLIITFSIAAFGLLIGYHAHFSSLSLTVCSKLFVIAIMLIFIFRFVLTAKEREKTFRIAEDIFSWKRLVAKV